MKLTELYTISTDKNRNPESGESELFALIGALVLICIGALFIILPWQYYLNFKKVLNEGGRITAKITNKSKVHRTDKNGDETIYYVSYYFKIKNKKIEKREVIGRSIWHNLNIGSTVEVAYEIEDPDNSFIVNDDENGLLTSLCFLCMPVIFSLLGLLPLLLAGKLLSDLANYMQRRRR